jgi:hypothetical protein
MMFTTSACCTPFDHRDPFDHAGVVAPPRIGEVVLPRKAIVRIEYQDLRARIAALKVIRHQARALERTRRATHGTRRYADRNHAALAHGSELRAEERGLLTRLPGMRHALGHRLRVAFRFVPEKPNAGRHHQPVVGSTTPGGELHAARRCIDRNNGIAHHPHPVALEPRA